MEGERAVYEDGLCAGRKGNIMFKLSDMTVELGLKKIIEIILPNIFLLLIHRVKMGDKWGKFLIIFAWLNWDCSKTKAKLFWV